MIIKTQKITLSSFSVCNKCNEEENVTDCLGFIFDHITLSQVSLLIVLCFMVHAGFDSFVAGARESFGLYIFFLDLFDSISCFLI